MKRSAGEAVTVKAIVVRDATDHYPPCILVQFPYLGKEVWVREDDLVPEPTPTAPEPVQYDVTINTEPYSPGPPYVAGQMNYGTLPFDDRDGSALGLFLVAVGVIIVIGTLIVTFGLGLR